MHDVNMVTVEKTARGLVWLLALAMLAYVVSVIALATIGNEAKAEASPEAYLCPVTGEDLKCEACCPLSE